MTDEQAAGDVTADHVTMSGSGAGTVEAQTVEMEQAGAGLIVASESVDMHQAGAGAIVSDGETRMLQSGGGVLMTNEAEVTQSFVGLLAAREAHFDHESKVLCTWVEAAIFGAVFGIVAAAVDLAFRGCRRSG
jgi:predicted DNA repair protein MutK